ncbi:unnamed protein product [Zymoseptoria tritici ST99CH_1A5]|uniref:Methyltransferase type 11 domain-containing protein n=1 Tax=Zymoseptoria tritici ST99CH_1A5 TaxID=1276529 RepID=A0A1Y6LL95_ZYMTR|nr:unnamed protein product [Zymoseptoria tritici ST99CH_1A5]
MAASSKILDNGAGSGMFTKIVREAQPECQIVATDISKGMISTLSQHNWSNVQTIVADAMDLQSAGLSEQTFTHSMGTIFIPFVPDPSKVIAEMQRVTKSGGVIALATWSRVSWVPVWQEAVREVVDADWTAPPLFHLEATELEDVKGLL